MRHPHSCGGPLSFEGSCGAGDCWTCHPEWQTDVHVVYPAVGSLEYETDPASDDEEDDRDDRTEEEDEE